MSKDAQSVGGEAEASPLHVVYPGEMLALAVRKDPVLVQPWGVKALLHEIPAMFGTIMVKMAPMLKSLKSGKFSADALVPLLLSEAGGELLTFVAWSVKLTPKEVEALTAEDFAKALRAVVRQNKGFFDQLSGMYQDLGRPLSSIQDGPQKNRLESTSGDESEAGSETVAVG